VILGLAPQALRFRPLRGLDSQDLIIKGARAREAGDSLKWPTLSPVSRAQIIFLIRDPGAGAPGFTLARFAGSILIFVL
jgi:hypothetical protein